MNDGTELSTIRNPADDAPIKWTADGSLVFLSDRSGAPGVWRQRVSGGRAQGDAQLVRGDLWRVSDVFITTDGRLIYQLNAGDRTSTR